MRSTVRRSSPILAAAFALLLCGSFLQAQSVADAARRSHTHSKSAKVYTNDDLPKDGVISVIGLETPAAPPEAGPSTDDTTTAGKQSASADTEGGRAAVEDKNSKHGKSGDSSSTAETQSELQKQAAEVKENISMLQREIEVSNREFRLQAATYYADAGNSLRNPKQWADQQRDHESEMKEKQTALDTAKQKLSDLEEQARREGIRLE